MSKKFLHEQAYRGEDLLKKLGSKQITICGGGALGSHLADTLARQGVTDMRVIDMDRVEEHNINTQVYGESDIGAQKAQALMNRLFNDTGIEIDAVAKELNAGNAKKLLKGSGLVVDTFDNSESRQIVYDFCQENGIECLHAGMFETYGEVVWQEAYTVPGDSVDGEGDVCDYPLARNLVTFVVSMAAEEIVDFMTSKKPRKKNWSITLKDMNIGSYR